MKKIIGLAGKIGSGKTTVAVMLKELGYEEHACADTLKDVVALIYGFDRDMLRGDTPERRKLREEIRDPIWGHTGRYALQYFGSEVCRDHFDPDIWAKIVERKVRNASHSCVVSDCRFENELNMIKRLGGTIIVLKRGDDALTIDKSKHRSEWEFLEWVESNPTSIVYLENNGTVEDLKKNLMELIN